MSKHRKHRESPVDASTSAPSSGQSPSQLCISPTNQSALRPRIWQLVGVLGASVALGFAFNTSNPVGIRFSQTTPESQSAPALTDQLPPPPHPEVASRRVATPLSPPPPIANPVVNRAPTPAPATTLTPAVTASGAIPTPPPAQPNPAPIHWAQAKPLVDAGQAVLVDVRAKPVYDAGHIPGAFSLPETSSIEEFTAFLNQHPTNLTLITYCSSTSCSQSARVAARLVTQFQRPGIKYMTGGYLEYQQAEAAKNATQPTP